MEPDDDTAGAQHDELVVVGAVVVEHDAGCAARAQHRSQLEVGVDRQACDVAERDERERRRRRRRGRRRHGADVAPGYDRPAWPGEGSGRAVVEGLLAVQRDRRRQHLQRDVVERAAGVVGANPEHALVEPDGEPLVGAGREGVGEVGHPVDHDGDVRPVHRDEHVVVDVRPDTHVRLSHHHPAGGVPVTHLELVGRDVDAGELEVRRTEVVEDDVGVGGEPTDRLDGLHQRPHLEVHRQVGVVVEDRHRIPGRRAGRDLQRTPGNHPAAAVGGEGREPAVVEGGSSKDVTPAARDVAGLRVGRPTGLLLPQAAVALRDQTYLAVRLAVPGPQHRVVGSLIGRPRRVGALAAGERVQEVEQLRRHLPTDRGDPERGERHDVGVELADPVDQAVSAGVADEDVEAGTADRAVLVAGVGVGGVVRAGLDLARHAVAEGAGPRRRDDVVRLQQIVAPAGPQRVAPGPADQPVVAEVAEDDVVAVSRHGGAGEAGAVGREAHAAADQRALDGRPVQEPVPAGARLQQLSGVAEQDGAARVVLVIEGELPEPRGRVAVAVPGVVVGAEGQRVAGVVGPGPVAAGDADQRPPGPVALTEARGGGLSAREGVVAGAAVQEVAAEAAEDHVVGVVGVVQRVDDGRPGRVWGVVEGRQVDGLGQRPAHVDRGGLDLARCVDGLGQHVAVDDLGIWVADLEAEHAVQGLAVLGQPAVCGVAAGVAAGEDPAVVAEDAVLTGTAGDPVSAPAADQVVVAGVAEDHVVTDAAVGGVVAALAVDLVVSSDVAHPSGAGPAVAAGGDRQDVAAGGERRSARVRTGADHGTGTDQAERARVVIRPADRVVEQVHAAHDEPLRAVVVVVEGDVLGGAGVRRPQVLPVGPHDADDAAVVADDRVGVPGVQGSRGGAERERLVVAAGPGTRAAEDEVGAVRAQGRGDQAEEVRAATDEVVLAQAAEDDVVAASTLDVVLTVGGRLEARAQRERAGRVTHGADAPTGGSRGADPATEPAEVERREVRQGRVGDVVDRSVALDHVVPQLAEEEVVACAPGEVVVSEAARTGGAGVRREVVEQLGDVEPAPPGHVGVGVAVGPGLTVSEEQAAVAGAHRAAAGVGAVGAAVEQGPAQGLEAAAVRVEGAEQVHGVTEDQIVLRTTVDAVVAGAADQHVAVQSAVDPVVLTVLQGPGLEPQDTRDDRRLDLLQRGRDQLGGVAGSHDVLDDLAVVAEDDVVVGAQRVRDPDDGRVVAVVQVIGAPAVHLLGEGVTVQQIAARRQRVGVLLGAGAHSRDGEQPGDEVDVDTAVAVEVVLAAASVDRVVPGPAG